MCSLLPNAANITCCGIQITFYEACGHTLTLADHSGRCMHFNTEESFPPRLYSHSVNGLRTPAQHTTMAPKLGSNLPFPQPQCTDLYRYISLIPGACGCAYPGREDSRPYSTLVPFALLDWEADRSRNSSKSRLLAARTNPRRGKATKHPPRHLDSRAAQAAATRRSHEHPTRRQDIHLRSGHCQPFPPRRGNELPHASAEEVCAPQARYEPQRIEETAIWMCD